MIYPKLKCYFIHIPKTAGTSIKKSLGLSTTGYHQTATAIKKSFPQNWDDFFKFSFVRNPWDRVVSIFCYYKFNKNEANNRKVLRFMEDKSFEDYCNAFCGDTPYFWMEETFTHPQRYLQKNWVTINGKISLDYIGKYETLEEDFAYICKQLKLKKPKLLHLRQSNSKSYRQYFNETTRNLVAKRFEEDIEFFKYTF